MSGQTPERKQSGLSNGRRAVQLGRYALRWWTTLPLYRRERKVALSTLHDWMTEPSEGYDARRAMTVSSGVARRFVRERQARATVEDRPDFRASEAELQLLAMFSDIISGYEATGGDVDVVWAINRATMDAEGKWSAEDERYASGDRPPDGLMIAARHSLYERLVEFAAGEPTAGS